MKQFACSQQTAGVERMSITECLRLLIAGKDIKHTLLTDNLGDEHAIAESPDCNDDEEDVK